MTCPVCHAETKASDNYCLKCGAPLRMTTPPLELPLAPPDSAGYSLGRSRETPTVGGPATAPPVPHFIVPGAEGSPTHRLAGPVAIGAAATLLILAVLALLWVSTSNPSVPPPSSAGPVPTRVAPTPVEGIPPDAESTPGVTDLIAAVRANNAAQIAALRTLDASVLNGKMAGQARDATLGMIDDLRSRGEAQDAQLTSIDYFQPQFQSADQATIRTVEVWQSTLLRADTGQPIGQAPPQTLHEVYHLSRQNGQWIVNQVDILEDQSTPAPDQ